MGRMTMMIGIRGCLDVHSVYPVNVMINIS